MVTKINVDIDFFEQQKYTPFAYSIHTKCQHLFSYPFEIFVFAFTKLFSLSLLTNIKEKFLLINGMGSRKYGAESILK